MSRRESVGRPMARQQSASGPPEMSVVTVAVLPPRLPRGMAPPSGIAASGCFGWDERLNYRHNEEVDHDEKKKKTKWRKLGLTTQRKHAHADSDLPPFTLRQVSYETWRKHYAKDKDGNYQGTHAPAEDCLLKPEDVAKWRLDEPTTKGDKWTRGAEVLPVYSEVTASAAVPHYEADAGQPQTYGSVSSEASNNTLATDDSGRSYSYTAPPPAIPEESQPPQKTIADGKTAAQIIEEAKNKPKLTGRKGWKDSLKRASEFTMMGN